MANMFYILSDYFCMVSSTQAYLIDLFSAAGCEKKLFLFICVMLITSNFDCSKRQLEAVFMFCKISAIVCYILLIVIAQKINFD